MTMTRKILDLMATRKSLTMKTIVKETGLTEEEVRKTVRAMRGVGYVKVKPEVFVLTPEGVNRQQTKNKTPKAVIAKKVAKRKEKRVADRAEITNAIHTQPSSVFHLGAQP